MLSIPQRAPRPLLRRRARDPLLVALVVSLAACGDSGGDRTGGASPARFESLDPKPVLEVAEPTIEHLGSLVPSPETPWKVEGANAKYVPVEDEAGAATGAHTLRLVRAENPTVVIAGPLAERRFNVVAVRAELGKAAELVLRVNLPGGWFTEKLSVEPGEGGELRTWVVEWPLLSQVEPEVEELRISVKGRTNYVRIDAVDLFFKPCSTFLPDAARAPGMVDYGGDARRSVGVTPERPVAVSFVAPEQGALCFSFGRNPYWDGEWQGATLRLFLESAEGELENREYPLERGMQREWQAERISLEGMAGKELTTRWEVDSPGEVACALAEVGVLTAGARPSPVLLITSDTHRFDHLGSSHRVPVSTPTLDALAERGVVFEDCFSSTNVTNPSHIALMTATHPRDTGIVNNRTRLRDAAGTLAEAFHTAGYATRAVLSAHHLADSVSGLGQGFDRMSAPRGYQRDCAQTVDVLTGWLQEDGDLPLFVWLHLFDAHFPYEPPEEYGEEYYPEKERAFDPALPQIPNVPPEIYSGVYPGLKDLEYPSAMYRGEVTYLDTELRRLFDHPAMKEAIIAFTADHGENLGDHQIYYDHADLYTQSLHVPMILAFPGGPSGVRCSLPTRQIDLGRTLLDITGNAGIEFPGQNLLSLLDAVEPPATPRFALAAHRFCISITEDGWHLTLHLRPETIQNRLRPAELHEVHLHYLPDDPDCEHDLLDQELPRAKRMRRALYEWWSRAEDLGWSGEEATDETTLRGLEALGYAGDATAEAPSASAATWEWDCDCEWCSRFR